jgi:hypothetical protein
VASVGIVFLSNLSRPVQTESLGLNSCYADGPKPNVLWLAQGVDSDGLFSRACGGHGSEVLWLHSFAALRTLLTEARLMR